MSLVIRLITTPGLLLGEEPEGEPLQMGKDLDPQVVHHPGGESAGDLHLEALGQEVITMKTR